uniref:uncharacterized protein LOC120329776 isoform X1 n=1 Tax=Styela clava TaxID=7725 RepID=UPI00193AB81B|nr:uncharacterized protein LOC120329776 isoform X1 [Styela clava]XP_039252496.1 uncharacterized protein LOC120329776 isoform X1 [Styela clava]
MKIIFILFYAITSTCCQDETVFHCSPRPGCEIARCDPVAIGWDKPGLNIDEHLRDKEFPITCKSKKPAQTQNTVNLFHLVSRNILDIENVKLDLKELEEDLNDKMKNINGFGKEISESRKYRNKIEEQSEEFNNLKRKDTQQSDEMKKLKEDLVELQEINSKLVKELNEQKKTNDEMKEEDPQQRQPRSRQITRPTINTQTTLKPTLSQEICKLKIGNVCYFAVISGKDGVNYYKAVELCKERNADVGSIRDEESYNAIMKFLKSNIPMGHSWVWIWTGIHFDPITSDVTPADSFIKWYSGNPSTGIDYKDRTNVYLSVQSNPNDLYQGMWNVHPTWEYHGVICEILI